MLFRSIRCPPQKKQGLALTSATGALRVLPTSHVHISSLQGYAASAAGFTRIHDDIYTSRGTHLELRNKSQGSRGRLRTDSLSKASRGNLCSVWYPPSLRCMGSLHSRKFCMGNLRTTWIRHMAIWKHPQLHSILLRDHQEFYS